jgi:steroid 5-alpha reductase family enzyme
MLPQTLLITYAVLFTMMSILWVIGMRMKNAAVVDVGWGLGFVFVVVVALFTIERLALRNLLIAGLVSLWGARLAWHLLTDRIMGGRPEEGRYVDIRARWKTNLPLKFFLFYQCQAILIIVLSLPMYLIALNPQPALSFIEWLGILVWFIGVTGESVADRQLKKFKDNPSNKGLTCQVGLWRYSRHPNYFFEWVIWVGYFVIALAAPYGWLAIISPAVMLYVLVRVTGIPLTEAQALRSRGEAYRKYQRTTSAFVPWFRKG